jgi:hypothetical protein
LLGQTRLTAAQIDSLGRDQLRHRVPLLGVGVPLEGQRQTGGAHRQQGQHDQGGDSRPGSPDPAPLVPLGTVEERCQRQRQVVRRRALASGRQPAAAIQQRRVPAALLSRAGRPDHDQRLPLSQRHTAGP